MLYCSQNYLQSNMKILTIVSNLEKGGTQRAAQVFAEGYDKLGHDSRVLSLYGKGIRYEELKEKNFIIYDGISKEITLKILKWSPNIVHIHSHGPKHEDIVFLIESLQECNPKVVETNVFSTVSTWSEKIDLSFQLSAWCQWLYYLRGGDNAKNIYIPYPVKTESFAKASKQEIDEFKRYYNIPGNAFVVGRIGQSYPGKWSYTIIDLFNKVAEKNSDVYLVLVNPPNSILLLVKESLFQERIIHIDSIFGDQNLAIAYSSFNVVYMGVEQGESFGMVIPEAILCGTPVISLATPWADNSQCEVTRNNFGGYVVNDTNSAVKIINKMISKNIQYNPNKGINHIKEKYDYLNVARTVVDYVQGSEINNFTSTLIFNKVFNILSDSYDKPNFLTKLFLRLNLRTLTVYSSGYSSWKKLPKKIIRKFLKEYK